MNPLSVALSGLGISTASTLTVIAQATTGTDTTGLAPYVGGGAGVIAVAALGEVTRRLLNGSLVPRATREVENELGATIAAHGQRESAAIKLAEDCILAIRHNSETTKSTAEGVRQHNERLAADLAKVAKTQAEHIEHLVNNLAKVTDDLRDEVRDIKRGIR